jgi:Mn-dependent DtxR family transcriptional regulator
MNDECLSQADLDALQSIAAANYMHMGKILNLAALSRLVERGYVDAGCFGQIILTEKGLQLVSSSHKVNCLRR